MNVDAILAAPSFEALEREALGCRRCPLAETRTRVVFGAGDPHADLVFVGEGPGADEDEQGVPFVGRAGRLLTTLIEGIGFDPGAGVHRQRGEVPTAGQPGSAADRDRDVPAVPRGPARVHRPAVVVTLGNFATKLLLDTKVGITKLRGAEYPQANGVVIIPTLHPSAVLRTGGHASRRRWRADFVLMKRALKRARLARGSG